jgi:uncharacterized protein YkwD
VALTGLAGKPPRGKGWQNRNPKRSGIMKATRGWIGVLWLGLCIFSPLAHAQQWGTWTYRNIRGNASSWDFTDAAGASFRGNNACIWARVPPNAEFLEIRTGQDGRGGYGSCDLYLRYGQLPTTTSYTRRHTGSGYQKSIRINRPAAGMWHIRLRGRSSYRSSVIVQVFPRSTGSSWRNDLLERINHKRAVRSLTSLRMNSKLQQAAQAHASDIAYRHVLSHYGFYDFNHTVQKRVYSTGYRYSQWEHVRQLITAGKETVDEAMASWSGQGAITDYRMRDAGFGFHRSSDNYGNRWVAVFARPR